MTASRKFFPDMRPLLFLALVFLGGAVPAQAAPRFWFISANGLQQLLDVDPGLAHTSLNSPNTFIAGDDTALRAKGWMALSRRQYRSVVDLQADSAPIGEPLVVYNPELENGASDSEKRDPVSAARAFASAIHARGKAVLLVPSCNLMKPVNGRGSPNRACVDRLLVPMAEVADYVDFEAQSMETKPERYSELVHYAVARMKAVNPNVRVIVQLSTADRPHTDASNDTLLECARSVADVVDGYWIFVGRESDGPARADHLIRALLQ